MYIDWDKAPEWANYHAFDMDGRGGWHEQAPTMKQWFWTSSGRNWPSNQLIPYKTDWKNTLIKKEQTRMTEELEKQLNEARLFDSIVHGFLRNAEQGFMSYEEAYLRAMLALHEQNEDLKKKIQYLIERAPYVVKLP